MKDNAFKQREQSQDKMAVLEKEMQLKALAANKTEREAADKVLKTKKEAEAEIARKEKEANDLLRIKSEQGATLQQKYENKIGELEDREK